MFFYIIRGKKEKGNFLNQKSQSRTGETPVLRIGREEEEIINKEGGLEMT